MTLVSSELKTEPGISPIQSIALFPEWPRARNTAICPGLAWPAACHVILFTGKPLTTLLHSAHPIGPPLQWPHQSRLLLGSQTCWFVNWNLQDGSCDQITHSEKYSRLITFGFVLNLILLTVVLQARRTNSCNVFREGNDPAHFNTKLTSTRVKVLERLQWRSPPLTDKWLLGITEITS